MFDYFLSFLTDGEALGIGAERHTFDVVLRGGLLGALLHSSRCLSNRSHIRCRLVGLHGDVLTLSRLKSTLCSRTVGNAKIVTSHRFLNRSCTCGELLLIFNRGLPLGGLCRRFLRLNFAGVLVRAKLLLLLLSAGRSLDGHHLGLLMMLSE